MRNLSETNFPIFVYFQVAYAQGSTLDIHMRSVGHQAKANRIMQQQQQIQQVRLFTFWLKMVFCVRLLTLFVN